MFPYNLSVSTPFTKIDDGWVQAVASSIDNITSSGFPVWEVMTIKGAEEA